MTDDVDDAVSLLSAGALLNEAIAERLFGLTLCDDLRHCMLFPGQKWAAFGREWDEHKDHIGRGQYWILNYSSDGNGMLKVIDRMHSLGYMVEVCVLSDSNSAGFWLGYDLFWSGTGSLPEAVARAALQAIEART